MDELNQASVPAVTQEQAKPKRILWKWSLIVSGCLLAFLMWQCGSALYSGSKLADQAAQHFHQQLNRAEFEQICSEADPGFSEPEKHDELITFLQSVHKKLGNATGEKRQNLNVSSTTGGTFVTANFASQFDTGEASETFVWRKTGDSLRLYRYNLNSKAFLK